jgi:hypothetical protein
VWSNKCVNPTVRSVTPRACARVAPARPAGYAQRWADMLRAVRPIVIIVAILALNACQSRVPEPPVDVALRFGNLAFGPIQSPIHETRISAPRPRSRPRADADLYFPATLRQSAPSEYWSDAAATLRTLDEVALSAPPAPEEAYRFSLENRSSIAVRVEQRGSRYVAVQRVFKWPADTDSPVLISRTWDLPRKEWDIVVQPMERYLQWEAPLSSKEICMDGGVWCIERWKNGQYQAVVEYCPNRDRGVSLAGELLLAVGRTTPRGFPSQ